MGKAPGYDGHCRSLSKEEIEAKLAAGEEYVIRLKMPYEGETIIKDYSENEGILAFLIENGIVSKPLRNINTGFTQCQVVKIL
jgi:hypothetical protein